MSFSFGSIHQVHQGLVPERFSDESRGIRDVYVSINQILLHRDNISLCMQQKWFDGQNSFFSEQTTADSSLLVSGEKRGKVRSKSALRLKRLRYRMRLIKEFLARWGVKFDRWAKISARFDYGPHLSVEAKGKLSTMWIQNAYRSLKLTPSQPFNRKTIWLSLWRAPPTQATIGSNCLSTFKPKENFSSTRLNPLIMMRST